MRNLFLLSLLFFLSCSTESDEQINISTPSPSIEKYSLFVNSTVGGTTNSSGGEYEDGTSVSITATPNSGYYFTGWTGSTTSNELTLDITITEDISLVANFQLIPVYSLTVTTTDGGTVDINEGSYEEGSEITITASASENYKFVNWTNSNGDQIGEEESITISLDSDIQIQANFSILEESIEFLNPSITSGVLSGEFFIEFELSNPSGIISKGVKLNDSIYTDEINENKIAINIESLDFQEYEVVFFVETNNNEFLSELYSITPEIICASANLVNSDMNYEQEFCTYTKIIPIKIEYSGTNVTVEYDDTKIPSGINIKDENSIIEIYGTPFSLTSDNFDFDITFNGLGECEVITKSISLNRSPNSPKLNYVSGSLSQELTEGDEIDPIEFEYDGSATGLTLSDLPEGLSYSVSGKIYKIEGSINSAGSYTSSITTNSQTECIEISESLSFIVNQPVSSGGGGSSEPTYAELQVSLDLLQVQITLLLVSLAETTCSSYSSSSSNLQSTYQTNLNEYNRLKNLVNNSTVLSNEQSAALLISLVANEVDLDTAEASFGTFPCPRTYIPDDNFEQVLIDNGFDDVLDDYVFTRNISGITCFSSPEQRAIFHEKGITDMTGIQDFTSLKFLSLYGNPITSIDVSSLANLGYIDLGNTNISSVDLSNNSQLTQVYLYNNTNLTSVNVTGLSNLRNLDLSTSGTLSSINVSSADKLTSIGGLNSVSCVTVSQSQLDNQVNGGVVPADYTTNLVGQRTYNFYDSCNILNAPAINWGNDSQKSKFKLNCN